MITLVLEALFQSDHNKVRDLCNTASLGLRDNKNEEVMIASLQAVGDLARHFDLTVITPSFITELVNYFLQCLNDPITNRNIKTSILSTICDLAVRSPAEIAKKLADFNKIFLGVFVEIVNGLENAVRSRVLPLEGQCYA